MTDEHIAVALNLSKIIGTALSGAFGLLGLLTDYRDEKTKKITTWGKVAFFGIVISTVVALVSQSLESAKQTRDAKNAALAADRLVHQSDSILHAVDRTIDPLTDVAVSWWMTVPIDDPEMASYKKRLLEGVAQLVDNEKEHHHDPHLGSPARQKADGTIQAVSIPIDSSLFPQQTETIPFYLLAFSGLHLQFFSPPQSLNSFRAADFVKLPIPNLEMQVSSMGPLPMSNSYKLQYDLVTKQLQIVAYQLPSDPDEWHSDGKIVSIFDLSNVQMAILLDNTMGPPRPAAGQPSTGGNISRLRAEMVLGSVIFQVKNRAFWVNFARPPRLPGGVMLQRIERTSSQGVPATVYVGTLPDDLGVLQVR